MDYADFVKSKTFFVDPSGFSCSDEMDHLFDFQRLIVKWALKKGKAAIFADTGLGKTAMQVTWAEKVCNHTDGNVLIVAPLCVSQQTITEAGKFGISAHYCRDQSHVQKGITTTNYEMLDHFDISSFSGIVLDESSILKSHDGKTRQKIIDLTQRVPYRLSCTATPSPNDYMELGNQAEFLGIMSRVEMLSMFFTHDGGETSKWRLKGHARKKFWKWMATWSVCIRKPSDLGFNDEGYNLPGIKLFHHILNSKPMPGHLFAVPVSGLLNQNKARKVSLMDRVADCASVVNGSLDNWIVWCNLNAESDELERQIESGKAICGADPLEKKEKSIMSFLSGELPVLITKPSITGFGLNFQHCSNMAFVGLTDSFEDYYQAVRRCFRFGQKKEVNVHLFYSEAEAGIVANLERKEAQHNEMSERMVSFMKESMQKEVFGSVQEKSEYSRKTYEGEGFTLHLSDCVELASEIQTDSIDYTIFSPPFASLYTYSNSDFDMGNVRDDEEFFKQFDYLVQELYRITRPGRLLSFHCMNLPTSKERDGVIGIRDFRGDLIRLFVDHGFIYHSEVVIWKDPVTAMQRTKALGLLHKTIRKDSSMSRQGIPDYLVTMRKPGVNAKPISHTPENFPVDLWQRYASPVWMDINPSKTLNKEGAREEEDERHICPLQLEVIERAIDLWTAPQDLVFSPFTGIGSEGYVALSKGRIFIGSELKESYWLQAIKNLENAIKYKNKPSLFENFTECNENSCEENS